MDYPGLWMFYGVYLRITPSFLGAFCQGSVQWEITLIVGCCQDNYVHYSFVSSEAPKVVRMQTRNLNVLYIGEYLAMSILYPLSVWACLGKVVSEFYEKIVRPEIPASAIAASQGLSEPLYGPV